jgi:hypothetical protein
MGPFTLIDAVLMMRFGTPKGSTILRVLRPFVALFAVPAHHETWFMIPREQISSQMIIGVLLFVLGGKTI